MNILICIKQVPNTNKIKIDKNKHTLIREGVESIINPFDLYAIEFALRIKDTINNVNISVISMGPPNAEKALRTALSLGVDSSYLISDKAFSGSDTLATSYVLSMAIKYIEKENEYFDLILCGKQAIDGDTAQIGPQLAEYLKYTLVTNVRELEIKNSSFLIKKETDEGFQILKAPSRSLFTITKPSFEARFPSLNAKIKAKKTPIKVLDLNILTKIDITKIGLKGSATKVKETYVNEIDKDNVTISGTPEEIVNQICKLIEK